MGRDSQTDRGLHLKLHVIGRSVEMGNGSGIGRVTLANAKQCEALPQRRFRGRRARALEAR